jgi:hypothetical protein
MKSLSGLYGLCSCGRQHGTSHPTKKAKKFAQTSMRSTPGEQQHVNSHRQEPMKKLSDLLWILSMRVATGNYPRRRSRQKNLHRLLWNLPGRCILTTESQIKEP